MQRFTLPDRDAIRGELEATADAFRALLASLRDEDLGRRGTGTRWTAGETLSHVVDSFANLPSAVAAARYGLDYMRPPLLVRPFAPLIQRIVVSRTARGRTRQELQERFDAAQQAALYLLDGVRDAEWQLTTRYFSQGALTIEDLFRLQALHFQEHAAQVEAALAAPA